MRSVRQESRLLLDVDRITVWFGGLVALSGVSFVIHTGEMVALIGPNGAGKTTLFNVLTGMVRPVDGRILWYGRDITHQRSDQISRLGISRTFQLIRVFPGLSVADNVRVGGVFGRSTAARPLRADDLRAILAMTDLLPLAQQPAGRLPMAERKRLEVARALATQPQLLLLDEVMAGLAPPDARAMMQLIRAVHRQGVAMIMIEHIMPAVLELAERIMVFHHGEKIADAPPAQVVRDPLVVEAYLGEVPIAQTRP